VVVDDLDVVRIAVAPDEADAPRGIAKAVERRNTFALDEALGQSLQPMRVEPTAT